MRGQPCLESDSKRRSDADPREGVPLTSVLSPEGRGRKAGSLFSPEKEEKQLSAERKKSRPSSQVEEMKKTCRHQLKFYPKPPIHLSNGSSVWGSNDEAKHV